MAPTQGLLLVHLVEVEQEKDWPEVLSRYLQNPHEDGHPAPPNQDGLKKEVSST